MILQCSALSKIRDKYLPRFVNLIPEFNYVDCDENIKIILDCTNVKCERASLEAVSKSFIYSIHCKRNQLFNWREDTISSMVSQGQSYVRTYTTRYRTKQVQMDKDTTRIGHHTQGEVPYKRLWAIKGNSM